MLESSGRSAVRFERRTAGGGVPCDRLLMIFPLVYLVGLLFIYVAKFEIYFSVDVNGLSAAGLAVGNLIVAVVATPARKNRWRFTQSWT